MWYTLKEKNTKKVGTKNCDVNLFSFKDILNSRQQFRLLHFALLDIFALFIIIIQVPSTPNLMRPSCLSVTRGFIFLLYEQVKTNLCGGGVSGNRSGNRLPPVSTPASSHQATPQYAGMRRYPIRDIILIV